MRPGWGPEQDVEAVRPMRQTVGSCFEPMVDAHTWWRMGDRSYSAGTVEQVTAGMGGYDIAWMEEPLPHTITPPMLG
jgi:L-alanine-DL-glutamate epimerase-like enolase superfamily enzyme